jgi:hypothetical protein
VPQVMLPIEKGVMKVLVVGAFLVNEGCVCHIRSLRDHVHIDMATRVVVRI